jgi:hypothetical protein
MSPEFRNPKLEVAPVSVGTGWVNRFGPLFGLVAVLLLFASVGSESFRSLVPSGVWRQFV